MNYFELFGLPVDVKVDKAALNKQYIALQKKFHPDFHTGSGEAEQMAALEQTSLANQALKVLQQPDLTLGYVLQLKGVLAPEEKYPLDPVFLGEMMELNEKMMEEEPGPFKQEVATMEASLLGAVQPILDNYHDATVTDEHLQRLKEYYYKKKYLRRILDRLPD